MSENASGIYPVEDKCLVKVIKAERVTGGGIVIPDTEAEKYDLAAIKAMLVASGVRAFSETEYFKRETKLDGMIPQPGSVVALAKYAGYPIKGKDGEDYRIVNDADITAVLEDENVGSDYRY